MNKVSFATKIISKSIFTVFFVLSFFNIAGKESVAQASICDSGVITTVREYSLNHCSQTHCYVPSAYIPGNEDIVLINGDAFRAVALDSGGNTPENLFQVYQAIYPAYCGTSFITEQQPASFGQGIKGLSSFGGILAGSNPADSTANALTNVEIIISRILGGLTTLATIFFIIYFVLGTFGWITAGGDSSKINKARDEMVQGVLGMIVVIVTYVLIGLIGNVIGLDVLNPAQQIRDIFVNPQSAVNNQPVEQPVGQPVEQIDWNPGVTQLGN